jgi:hypothetical protein
MTRPLASVLSARHDISTYRATAPARFVVRFYTSSSRVLLSAVTALSWAHGRARRTWTSMTKQVTWMWTRLWKFPLSAAGLSARVWRQTSDGLGVQLFLAPTCV